MTYSVTRLLLKATLSFALLLPITGCDAPLGPSSVEPANFWPEEPESLVLLGHDVSRGVLALVNDQLTDVPFLTGECMIGSGAAERIVAHRQGPDSLDGTADDDPFDTITELDEVGLVGEQTLNLLAEAAERLGLVPVLELEGVPFTEDEVQDTLLFANGASLDVLDVEAGLDIRAARSLTYGRPYQSLVEVAERPFVGPSALTAMKWFAPSWVDSLE